MKLLRTAAPVLFAFLLSTVPVFAFQDSVATPPPASNPTSDQKKQEKAQKKQLKANEKADKAKANAARQQQKAIDAQDKAGKAQNQAAKPQ